MELDAQKDVLAPLVQDTMMYGKQVRFLLFQLPKNKKENVKTLFKVEFILFRILIPRQK